MNFRGIIYASLLSGFMACSSDAFEKSEKDFTFQTSIPVGGNTYVTGGAGSVKVSKEGIKTWSSEETIISTYFKVPEEQEAFLKLQLAGQVSGSEIRVTVGDKGKNIVIPASATGTIDVGAFKFAKGYNKVDIQGVSKTGETYPAIAALVFKSVAQTELTYVKDNESNRFYWGRRGPSVHLSYTLPEEKNFKWFYNEVTIPVGEDPNGSYYMANGFGEGYFGIQANSDDERRVLFSVWSPFHTDNPDDIPEDQQIKLLKKGEDVNTGEFGNEGSGGQSFLRYKWITGNTYKFLNSVEPDGKGNTIYTAYFFAPEVGEWKLIASFLRPKTDTWYKRPHSFLENFIDRHGYIGRKGLYANQWAMDSEGNWVELTEAKFTGDDIARRGYRQDYAGGEENGIFFMRNGGFFNEMVELNSMHNRKATGNQPEIDFSSLD